MRILVFSFIILGFFNYTVQANAPHSTDKTIEQSKIDKNSPVFQVTTILQKGIDAVRYESIEKCIHEFDNIMDKYFAHPFMCKFIFAKFWKSIPNAQKRVVNICTRNLLIDQYSSRFFGYSEAKVKVFEKAKKISNDRYIVSSELNVKNETYKIDWYMQLIDGMWLVMDVRVNGTNILAIQRAGIEGAIEKNGLNAFIKTFINQYMDLNKVINRAQSEKSKINSSAKTVLFTTPMTIVPM